MTAQVRPRDTCHVTLHVTGHAPLVTTHSWWCEVRGGDAVTSLSQFCHASPRRCHVSRDGPARGGPGVRTHVSRDIQNQMRRNAGAVTSAPAPANLITPLEADWGGLSQCPITAVTRHQSHQTGLRPREDGGVWGQQQTAQHSEGCNYTNFQGSLVNKTSSSIMWRQPTRDLFSFHVDQQ